MSISASNGNFTPYLAKTPNGIRRIVDHYGIAHATIPPKHDSYVVAIDPDAVPESGVVYVVGENAEAYRKEDCTPLSPGSPFFSDPAMARVKPLSGRIRLLDKLIWRECERVVEEQGDDTAVARAFARLGRAHRLKGRMLDRVKQQIVLGIREASELN